MAFRMAGDRRADLRRQPAAGQRLAGPGRAAAAPTRRSSCSTARPACSRRRRRAAARSSRRAGGSSSRTLATLGSARWVLIESATNQPRELESPDALLDLAEHRARRAPRPTSRRCCRPPATTSRPTSGPDRDLDLLRPPRERLERRQRPLAGPARRLPRVPPGRPVPPARLSADGPGNLVGAGDRRPPPARPATAPSCWSRSSWRGRADGEAAGRRSPSSSRSTGPGPR